MAFILQNENQELIVSIRYKIKEATSVWEIASFDFWSRKNQVCESKKKYIKSDINKLTELSQAVNMLNC
jgi:hypothetical protein